MRKGGNSQENDLNIFSQPESMLRVVAKPWLREIPTAYINVG
jgi:hypothetical protein